MTQSPAARSQEAANQAEFFLTTSFAPAWKLAQRIGPLRRAVNSGLINRAVEKMGPRPYPFSTMAPYTSWPSLTDRRYDARHLAPVADDAEDLPAPERVAELFRRAGETAPCPKSTVLFAYFAMWFTDGFLRSDRAERPDPRKNDSTHEIDLCQIYGLTGEATAELRRGELGLLKSQMLGGEEFPPYLYENGKRQFSAITVAREEQVPPERKAGLLAIGTDTANVQIGHVMMNVLFIREHNRIATELLRENPGWDDERLFQTTRNILIVLLIKIVIEEYINHITPYHFRFCLEGGDGFQRARWMRPNRMASEFNLLYRWHSLIPSTLVAGGRERTIEETAFNAALVSEHGLGRLFGGGVKPARGAGRPLQHHRVPVGRRASQHRQGPRGRPGSLQRLPRELPVPARERLRPGLQCPRVQDGLRSCYGNVERIEFFTGLFAEDPRPNSVLPSLIGRMVGIDAFSQALTNPLLAPRVFKESTFSPLGWRTIHTTRNLAEILQRNVPARERPYLVTMTRSDWRRQ